MKKLLKTVLKTVAPQKFAEISSARENRHGQRILEQQGVAVILDAVTKKYGEKVQAGPFADMNYGNQSIGSSSVPKLVGSYEAELHPLLQELLAKSYQVVVDVGCAEGYYAVGIAMRLSGKPHIYAYDIDKKARQLCQQLAAANGVEDRITISGFCDSAELEKILEPKSLVICDCEGYEGELLNPAKTPALATAEVLVELHDVGERPMLSVMRERFSASHEIQVIGTSPRRPENYPNLSFLTPQQQTVALSEFRHGEQEWAYMKPLVV